MDDYILSHGSYVAIFLLLVLTGVGLPLPEEIVIVAAGVLSSPAIGRLDPLMAVCACLAGALVGDGVMYGIGRGLGRTFLRRHRWFTSLVHAECEERMEKIVQRHGLKVFFLSRFLVGIRSPIYLAMGILRIDFRRFLLYDAMCRSLVVGVFFLLSYFCGGWIGVLIRDSQYATTGIALTAAVLAGAYYLIWKRCRHGLHLDE